MNIAESIVKILKVLEIWQKVFLSALVRDIHYQNPRLLDTIKVTSTTFWLERKNLPKCTKFCSARKLKVAAKNFGLLTKIVSCIGKYGGLKAVYQAIFLLHP